MRPPRLPTTSAAATARAFVALMNAKANELGLTHTHFANPDGLDEAGHYSSARDLTRLAQAAMESPVVRRDRANEGEGDLRRPTTGDVE